VAATDAQQLVFTTADANGNQVSAKVNLNVGDARTTALASINLALQTAGGNLAKLVAVNADGAGTGIKIMGSQNFQTFIGATTTGGTGVNDGAGVVAADQNHSVTSAVPAGAAAGAVDISTVANAQQAVNALASAVATLGSAQAVVGKGENNFNYAMNLAQSQSTNLAAAESRIRDADLASEAANLTKAQILIQAGTAALAQANSAPQAILSLLK